MYFWAVFIERYNCYSANLTESMWFSILLLSSWHSPRSAWPSLFTPSLNLLKLCDISFTERSEPKDELLEMVCDERNGRGEKMMQPCSRKESFYRAHCKKIKKEDLQINGLDSGCLVSKPCWFKLTPFFSPVSCLSKTFFFLHDFNYS